MSNASYCLKIQTGDNAPRIVSFSDFSLWYNAPLEKMAVISLLTPFFLGQNYWFNKIPQPYRLQFTPPLELPLVDSDVFIGAIVLDPSFNLVEAQQQEVPPTPDQISFAGFNFDLLKQGLLSGFGNYLRSYDGMFDAVANADNWELLQQIFIDYQAQGALDLTIKKETLIFKILRCTEDDINEIKAQHGSPSSQYVDAFDAVSDCISSTSENLDSQGLELSKINNGVVELASLYKVKMAWGEYLYLSDEGYNYIPINPSITPL